MANNKWLMATRNEGKIRELQHILAAYPVEVLGLRELGITEESPETGESFIENAMQKACFYYELAGIPTIADDSGLEVDALNGAPGIHSARFGGFPTHQEKCAYLLGLMNDVSPEYRTARFHCAAVYYDGRRYMYTEGSVEGFLGQTPVGIGGFGYDPIFHPSQDGPSMAQLTMEQKNKISHRTRAFKALVEAFLEEQASKQMS